MKIKEISEGILKGLGQAVAPEYMGSRSRKKSGLGLVGISPDLEPEIDYTEPEVDEPTPSAVPPSRSQPVAGKPWSVKLDATDATTATRDATGTWTTDNGETVTDKNDLARLNAMADAGITDWAAEKAANAQKDAEMRARLQAREKDLYQPVDVSRPAQEPIKIGKETIRPDDPRYAKLAARLK